MEAKEKPKQRMDERSGFDALENLIKNFKDPHQPPTTFEEDYAGGSQEFVNMDIVHQLIKKLTR